MQWSITNRPRSLGDLYGLPSLKKYFYEKVNTKDWPKALLLRGQFGNGKSTVASIVASMLVCQNPKPNGDPCGKCASCNAIIEERFDRDVIRIDGGQSGKADIIETINEHISTPPMYDSRKVIIIEEVQELSNAAKNSLLKTLEHPRDKIHFILLSMENGGNTGFGSRCVTFMFKKLPIKELMFFLKKTMEDQGYWNDESIPMSFKTQGLATLAQAAQGSIRQALQILEQCIDGKIFTEDEIAENLGYINEVKAADILSRLLALDNTVWSDIYKCDPYDLYGIMYKIITDAALFKYAGFVEDEDNAYFISNTRKVAAAESFETFLTAFNTLSSASKPFLRKAEFLSCLIQAFHTAKSSAKIMREVSDLPIRGTRK